MQKWLPLDESYRRQKHKIKFYLITLNLSSGFSPNKYCCLFMYPVYHGTIISVCTSVDFIQRFGIAIVNVFVDSWLRDFPNQDGRGQRYYKPTLY